MIDCGRPRSLTAREIISAPTAGDFTLRRQAKHADGRRVTVSIHHPAATFPPKTLRSMLELQAGWTDDDLRRLTLIRERGPDDDHVPLAGPGVLRRSTRADSEYSAAIRPTSTPAARQEG